MTKLVGIKANVTGLTDTLGAGVIKTITDPLVGTIAGDNNLLSGIVKTGLAVMISGKGGRLGNCATLAFGVGGGQDLTVGLLSMFGIGAAAGAGARGGRGRGVM